MQSVAVAENVKHVLVKVLFACVEAEKMLLDYMTKLVTLAQHCHVLILLQHLSLLFEALISTRYWNSGLLYYHQEYDVANDNGKNPTGRLAHQKENLPRHLGK